jgi:Domain of unknown function (DUF4395)
MSSVAKMHFVEQQGLGRMEDAACERQFSALMFQPRAIGVLVLVGLVTQSAGLFLALAALLVWNVAAPRWNLFDALHDALIARPRGLPRLGPAPAPRRFAQGMSAAFMLGIGVSLLGGHLVLARILEAFLVVALLSLLAGRFCLGSYIYHLVAGHKAFANQTPPWRKA